MFCRVLALLVLLVLLVLVALVALLLLLLLLLPVSSQWERCLSAHAMCRLDAWPRVLLVRLER